MFIIRRTLSSLPAARGSLLGHRIAASYVKHEELQKILDEYHGKQDTVSKVQKWGKYFQHRVTEGMKCMKNELLEYRELSKISDPTEEQKTRIKTIKNDINKMLPVFLIYLMPASPLLFAGYLKYFPDSMPTWFEVDKEYHERHHNYRQVKFQETKSLLKKYTKPPKFSEVHDIEALRELARALTGKHIDGTHILSQLQGKRVSFDDGVMRHLSKMLLKRQIRKFLKEDLDLSDKEIEEDEKIIMRLQEQYNMAHPKEIGENEDSQQPHEMKHHPRYHSTRSQKLQKAEQKPGSAEADPKTDSKNN